jgi:DNA-directed RNA polymerase specialized sigma24 family protein
VSPFLDRTALETLYDRHESSVYNFCVRTTGSRDLAASATKAAFLEMCREARATATDDGDALAGLLAAARRERTRLPEAAGADSATAGSPLPVRDANGRLELRSREVLVLRELLGCSYAEIGRIVGAGRETVAQLLWRARLGLRDELEGSALLSIAPLAGSCRRALALIVMDWDGELEEADERAWLRDHLRTCGKCRLSRQAARQASASYREWPPAAAPLGMRESLPDVAAGGFARGPAGRPGAVSET